jgi:hypothetical protein
MKISRSVSITALSLLLGSSALIYAQDETKPQEPRPEETKPARPEATSPAQDEAKPPRQDDVKPPRQDEAKPPKQNDEMKSKHDRPQDEMKPRPQENTKPPKQGEHVDQQNHNQHSAAQRGGHIPDDKFHSHFGREHKFVVRRTIVEGQPTFQYGGYSFELIDAWPADWADTDDCYIDYIDGEYFLFDLLHPGVRVAVFVVM